MVRGAPGNDPFYICYGVAAEQRQSSGRAAAEAAAEQRQSSGRAAAEQRQSSGRAAAEAAAEQRRSSGRAAAEAAAEQRRSSGRSGGRAAAEQRQRSGTGVAAMKQRCGRPAAPPSAAGRRDPDLRRRAPRAREGRFTMAKEFVKVASQWLRSLKPHMNTKEHEEADPDRGSGRSLGI
eukprot:gene16837-biopygen2085